MSSPVRAIPLSGPSPELVKKAWDDVKESVSNLPTPSDGTIALFEPSKSCKVVIDWVYSEVSLNLLELYPTNH